MAKTGGDILIETLIDWGVDTVFGLPGDGINGIMEALRKRQDKIRFIQVRHEEAAAFMACAYAKYTGKLGVCLATSGPGRHPPAERPLRRQAGRPAGAGDHRPCTIHDLIGTHYPAGRGPRQAVSWTWRVYNARVMGADARRERRPTWPAAPRSATAAWRTSPSRSTSRTQRSSRRALEAQRARITPPTSWRPARRPAGRRRPAAAPRRC